MKNEKVDTVMIISSRDFSDDEAFKNEVKKIRAKSSVPILTVCRKADMPTSRQ